MVSLKAIQASNSRIASVLPPLVAVFVGGTSGVGEVSLKQFAKRTRQPCVYFVGRSQEAGDRIAAECKALNPDGQYTFVKADTSLIANVDHVCRDIKDKEKAINLLFITTGTLLPYTTTTVRRVVSVFAATKEDIFYENHIDCWNVPLRAARGHAATLVTLGLKAISKEAPEVSFIHNFPGFVKGKIDRDTTGVLWFFLRNILKVMGSLGRYIPDEEAGESHLFFATSARFPDGQDSAPGVPVAEEVGVAKGIDGKIGSGVYSIDHHGESMPSKQEELIAKYLQEGMPEKIWNAGEDLECRRRFGMPYRKTSSGLLERRAHRAKLAPLLFYALQTLKIKTMG